MMLALAVSGCGGQTSQSSMVVSSNPELAVIGEELLPRLAERSGMDLSHPVRIEARQVASRFVREARRRPLFPAVLKDAFFELGASLFQRSAPSERGSRERER